MPDQTSVERAYRAAHEAVLIVQHDARGVIEMSGSDRIDLLHRLSTNDLEGMQPDRTKMTVFTDPVGRTIDVATILTLRHKLLLVTSPGRTSLVQDWLQRHIFFPDNVNLTVSDGEWALFGAYGPLAEDRLAIEAPSADALRTTDSGIYWSIDDPVPGFMRLMRPDQSNDDWIADTDSSIAFDILRVEAGLPEFGTEILDDSIPLEVGLWDAVSFEKGCYVGQEIIARMESRGRLAKRLIGVRLESQIEAGTSLRQHGQKVGKLTSVVCSPSFGWIGLASGRPSALSADGGRVELGNSGKFATLVELPFSGHEIPAPA